MTGTTDTDIPCAPIPLGKMKIPKASKVLAEELTERILSGEFAEGTGLAPERELVVQTGLSRTTVREALRILEVQGLIHIKSGRAGGAFVQRPGEQAMANTVDHIIRGHQISPTALLETRGAIEPFCARLAASTRTEAQLAQIEAADAVMADPALKPREARQAEVDWHIAVSQASNNELLSGLMMALLAAATAETGGRGATDARGPERARSVRLALSAHVSVTDAIRRGDAAAAEQEMQRHIEADAFRSTELAAG